MKTITRTLARTMITLILVLGAIAAIVVTRSHGPSAPAYADAVDGEELSIYMDHLRRLTHKAGLSIDTQNPDLAAFYSHEIGEVVELIKTKFPQYDGFQVGALITAMLPPHLTLLDKAIEKKDWDAAGSAYDNLLSAGCNGCHLATQHPFVKIIRSKTNPYNQDFSP